MTTGIYIKSSLMRHVSFSVLAFLRFRDLHHICSKWTLFFQSHEMFSQPEFAYHTLSYAFCKEVKKEDTSLKLAT
jgi:hypothetical protein